MNKIFSAALLLSTVCAGPILAQTTTPPTSTMAPAVTTSGPDTTTAAPLAGANSFTMSQAQTRLKDNGFTDVSELVKDANSVWRGHAMKDGKPVAVAVDYKGNITTD
jgi:putative membrane protein